MVAFYLKMGLLVDSFSFCQVAICHGTSDLKCKVDWKRKSRCFPESASPPPFPVPPFPVEAPWTYGFRDQFLSHLRHLGHPPRRPKPTSGIGALAIAAIPTVPLASSTSLSSSTGPPPPTLGRVSSSSPPGSCRRISTIAHHPMDLYISYRRPI
jgi:hypothetical protein